ISGPASLAEVRRRVPGGTGGRQTTLAATASCPSRNTLADTVITSPTTALAGYRPPATVGEMSFNPMRPATGPTYRYAFSGAVQVRPPARRTLRCWSAHPGCRSALGGQRPG